MSLIRHRPRAKVTDFILASRELQRKLPPGMFEVLMVRSNGHILEGLTSNFFAVHAGVLRTAGEGTLEGVARSIDLEIAEGPLPVMLRSVSRMDVPALSEAFVTSSSREALPMVVVDRSPLVRAGQSW